MDPVEHRGLEYHTGVSFTLFARRVRGELGRGGRYESAGESSTGFSVYLDSLLRALPAPLAPPRLFLPYGTSGEARLRLRREGWVTVAGLTPVDDPRAEARRQGCSHCYEGGKIRRTEDR